ncbi:unnamed protein product [Rotaria sp. Silwood2]|nr:unnamed protein product [Rotaria sp. Silwood2]CAF4379393.1 unnamed protein product [Rotaria sp. Silwood2]
MFLKEREKLFLSNANSEKSISPSSPNETRPLIIDEIHLDQHEADIQLPDKLVNSSIVPTTVSKKDLLIDKPLPDPYTLPTLPNQVIDAINSKQMEKYPTRAQYTIVVNSILNYLSIEPNTKKAVKRMEEKTETIKTDYQNNAFNDPEFKRLWFDTYEYRKDYIKQNTTADIMKQFPAYTNPFTKPATPQPSIVIEDDAIKIYLDWTYVCSSTSMEQFLAIIVGLYYLMNLKFHPYRTIARFLYVYLLHDKQLQTSNIRRFCKEYNIELEDQSLVSSDLASDRPPDHPPEQTKSKEASISNDTTSTDEGLIVIHEQNDSDQFTYQIPIIPSQPTSTNLPPTQKRKANQIDDSDQLLEENNPPTKKAVRGPRRKRR